MHTSGRRCPKSGQRMPIARRSSQGTCRLFALAAPAEQPQFSTPSARRRTGYASGGTGQAERLLVGSPRKDSHYRPQGRNAARKQGMNKTFRPQNIASVPSYTYASVYMNLCRCGPTEDIRNATADGNRCPTPASGQSCNI